MTSKLTAESLEKFRSLLTQYPSPALESILHKFYLAMSDDILVGFFFVGKDLKYLAERQALFLRVATRIIWPKPRDLKAVPEAHQTLPPILAGHFDRRLRILESVLEAEGFSAVDIRTWIKFESSFRQALVG